MLKVCFLHVGTHRTGTTYLQTALQANEYALAADGLYIPNTGRISPGCGHHNIAWELIRDPRYDSARGNLAQLIEEVSATQSPRVCVSSEDFGCLWEDVEILRTIRSKFNAIEYTVKALFFLRPQADYAESFYGQAVTHGLSLDFFEFLKLRACEKLKSPTLYYDVMLERFASVLGQENIIVRPFRRSARPERLLVDFLSQMVPDFQFLATKYQLSGVRENESLPFSQVLQLFVQNNLQQIGQAIPVDPVSLTKSVQPSANYEYLSGPFDPVGLIEVATSFWKYGLSNLKVFKTYRVLVPFVSFGALGRDLLAFLGLDMDSRRRKRLLKKLHRFSDNMILILNQVSGIRQAEPESRDSHSTDLGLDASEVVVPWVKSDHFVTLRQELVACKQRINQLSSSLAERERQLEDLKHQAAMQLAEKNQEINRIRCEQIGLQRDGNKADWSSLRRVGLRFRGAVRTCWGQLWQVVNRLRNRNVIGLVIDSGLFDPEFYLAQHPKLQSVPSDPATHFIEHGTQADRDPHPLFDTSYYLEQNPDVAKIRVNPLIHFIKHGAQEGRSPHPLFDTLYYREQNPDVVRGGRNLLAHFLAAGALEGRDPCALFSISYYLEQNPDVAGIGVNPLIHFIMHGAREGRDPHPLFDTSYYFEQNPDVARAGINPLVHFIERGARLGRNPSPLFDVSYYWEQIPDVAALVASPRLKFLASFNPVVHFIQFGVHKRLNPHPLFDVSYYLRENPRVANSGLNPLVHFTRQGGQEGRAPHPLFDASYYLQKNPDIAGTGVNPLAHFIIQGASEGRDPHPLFDTSYYLQENPDVARAGINPLIHFLRQGARERRNPSLLFDVSRYLDRNPEVATSGVNPLVHSILGGAPEQ